MTNQNQQPQRPSPPDQPPGHSTQTNSSWATAQSINTNPIKLPRQTSLPEQKGPRWATSSRPMPATQYQQGTSTAHMSPTRALPSQALAQQPPVIPPAQSFQPKHRTRTFFFLFLLMLALLVALGAILGPNLFANIPGTASNSSTALGAS